MRVLWVTYAALGKAAELLENRQSQSGTWIDATAIALVKNGDVELTIACISSNSKSVIDSETNIVYRGISEVKQISGVRPCEAERKVWATLIAAVRPEVIMIWGTEYANGLAVIEEARNIPVFVFIQGVLGKIVEYPLGKLPMIEVMKMIGPINAAKFLHFKKVFRAQSLQCRIEEEMICKCSGIITDNDWAISYYRSLCPKVKNYYFPLPVNSIFLNGERNCIEQFSLFTIDGGNPAKGVFHLIKALRIVKKQFPDVKLYIPGRIPTGKPKILKESPYYTYLTKLIRTYDLEENVVFLGQLTQMQMKEQLEKCNVFVMPSAIENHSSSLREAMYMGVPSISSLVGCVSEFTTHGVNALTYRYEEEDILASQIIKLLNNSKYAEELGKCGKQTINKCFPQDGLGNRMLNIYYEVLSDE